MSGIILRGIFEKTSIHRFEIFFFMDDCKIVHHHKKTWEFWRFVKQRPHSKLKSVFVLTFLSFGDGLEEEKKNSGIGLGRHIIIKIDWWEKISVTVLFFHGDCNRNQNRKKMFLPNYKPYKPVEFYIYTIVVKNIYVLGKI